MSYQVFWIVAGLCNDHLARAPVHWKVNTILLPHEPWFSVACTSLSENLTGIFIPVITASWTVRALHWSQSSLAWSPLPVQFLGPWASHTSLTMGSIGLHFLWPLAIHTLCYCCWVQVVILPSLTHSRSWSDFSPPTSLSTTFVLEELSLGSHLYCRSWSQTWHAGQQSKGPPGQWGSGGCLPEHLP